MEILPCLGFGRICCAIKRNYIVGGVLNEIPKINQDIHFTSKTVNRLNAIA